MFWSLLALGSYHLLFKITKYVNWRLTLEQKIPLPNYIHILYCEVRFHLFLMTFNSGKSRDGKFSQHFPNIKKNMQNYFGLKVLGLRLVQKSHIGGSLKCLYCKSPGVQCLSWAMPACRSIRLATVPPHHFCFWCTVHGDF